MLMHREEDRGTPRPGNATMTTARTHPWRAASAVGFDEAYVLIGPFENRRGPKCLWYIVCGFIFLCSHQKMFLQSVDVLLRKHFCN